ncbi:MAG TPA: hypothetical protein VLF18_01370 [Tahibacter sp.]|uniref:hypothetical protein n=1 Tax=Tahibacter sp. TaxID=2056211 RepID=UPI002B7F3D3D|nr:hypothetical protein [Tahibacter sp.]HSX58824.1 hypothetical protein [Tahibacter sp.]
MHWAEAIRTGVALTLTAALLGGCASPDARRESQAEPVKAATTLAAPPAAIAATELPADSLLIVVTARNAYTVQDATASCEGLPALLEPYRERNLVVAGSDGFALTIADALCVATIAKQRGGKAWMTHPDGLRSIDIQN